MAIRVPIIYLQQFAAHLKSEGIALPEIFEGTQITEAMLADPDATVSRKDCHTLFVRASRLSRHPGMVLRIASQLRPTDHGFLGHAMICAPNLRTSLKLLERFGQTRTLPLSYRLAPCAGGARVMMQLTEMVGHAHRAYMEWGLMIALSTTAPEVAHRPVRPSLIALDYPEPDYRGVYDEILRCPIRFSAGQCYIEFTDAALDAPTVHSNRELQLFCEQRCELILKEARETGDLANRVRAQLLAAPPPFPDADSIAGRIHLSGRALRRRLREEGSSFRQIVQDVRQELARQYLHKADLTVEEVATLLGYSEAPAFSRAFKLWTGQSPEHYRRQLTAAD